MSRHRIVYYLIGLSLVLAAVLGLMRSGAPAATRSGARLGPAGPAGSSETESIAIAPAGPAAGPFLGAPVVPASFDGDVRTLPPAGLEAVEPGGALPEFELRRTPETAAVGAIDPNLQVTAGSGAMPTPARNFAGLDYFNFGNGYPPDTNGDVGPNHYIQTVNTSMGIYDKTGSRLAAYRLNTFFAAAGTGTACDTSNRGDPVVVYDAFSGRWIVSDFAWGNTVTNTQDGPYYECLAVSKTADPVSGGWWFYAIDAGHHVGGDWLNDYPKLGVWSDGLYLGANMFDCLTGTCSSATRQGVRAYAFNRDQLINGQTLTPVYFDVPGEFSLFPSNLRGTPPPNGSPNYFLGLSAVNYTSLVMYKFAVNWNNLAASTFTGPQAISISTYTDVNAGIPQPGTTTRLDVLADRIMVQNQYRNRNGTESLWANHTVFISGTASLRWYELRNLSATPTVYEQGTYFPADNVHRWMGSAAVDKLGNMAIGYSAGNAATFPGIRYTGRLVTDTLNTLGQAEVTLVSGAGSQNITCGGIPCTRWGDYSAMTVDPVDDCTFWYTTEYYTATGSLWQTRIGSFRYPVCTGNLTLSAIGSQAALSNTVIGPLTFTVASQNAAAASVLVTATSSNTALVPNAAVQLGGSGLTRTVTLTPLVDMTGVTTITLTADDGVTTTTTAFEVRVAGAYYQSQLPLVVNQFTSPCSVTFQDGGFEAFTGSPGSDPYWQQSSLNFGTPLCTTAGCGNSWMRTGSAWAWFGGVSPGAEVGMLTQTIKIPDVNVATLSFYFWIGAVDLAGSQTDDVFQARLDGIPVFTATAAEAAAYPAYTLVSQDISAYADGQSHTLSFYGATVTVSQPVNLHLDDVTLTCGW